MRRRAELTIAHGDRIIAPSERTGDGLSWNVILFDMDGTLSDSGIGITLCAHYALTEMGFPVGEPASLRYFVGPPLEESFTQRHGMDAAQTQEAIRLFRERYAEKGICEHAPYPGVPEMLRRLHGAGKCLCVASSKPRIYAERILESYGVRDCFTEVMGSELDGRFGTKTLVLEELLRRLHMDGSMKARTVMVGDRHYDVEGAHDLGLKCIAVEYGYAEPGELTQADLRVPTVAALEKLLLAGE